MLSGAGRSTKPESVVVTVESAAPELIGREQIAPEDLLDFEPTGPEPVGYIPAIHAHMVALSEPTLALLRTGVEVLLGARCGAIPWDDDDCCPV
jgi:hypothetical protein